LTQLRRANRDTQQKGLEMLREWLKANDLNITTATIRSLCEAHGMEKQEHLLLDIGNGTITLSEKDLDHILGMVKKNKKSRWRRFVPFLKSKKDNEDSDEFLIVQDGFDKDRACVISEDNINKYVFSHDCCHPIPGDDVIGYIDGNDHIELHQRSCQVVNRLRTTYPHRILAVRWNMHSDSDDLLFDAVIVIRGIDRKGIARDVALVIADQMDINIHKLSISSDKGIFEGRIEIRVHDREELTEIIDALKKVPDLTTVIREY
jgi:GTP pyrophosphokinase